MFGASAVGVDISSPHYGADVTSPVTVRGHVTGVDVSIRAAVRSIDGAVDVSDPIAAGGDDAAWVTILPYSDRQHGGLSIIAWTGGAVSQHGEFAVVGVTAAS